ncbi:RDD family protein [Lysobacter silvisoli]|uniref:RDD family protein n=1 Tax=Lysobacter silvisoli TaxID=2293254 RepID=A0A371JYS2_9GAMM|nr:RDD family protein [Lysobacter silvisoli]RDZ26816.1 RDD family protein [Lysobacter silvisoli]
MLDTYREVVTPEGVALRLPAAGPVPRALAWGIDLCIRLVLLFIGGLVFGLLGDGGMGAYLVVMFLLLWFYHVAFEAMWDGRTPGKRALGLRVVASNGAPVGWMGSFLRNLLRTVDMLPVGYAFGLVASYADPWGRRLGDMVAGTLVVHDVRRHDTATTPPEPAMAPPEPLLPHEQAAMVAFAERAPRLTAARQAELADLAQPLTGQHGAAGVARLYGIANWLLGRR